jgi:hypothetical protein
MGVNEPDLVALTLAEFGYLEDDKPASTDFGIDLTLSTGLLPKKKTHISITVLFSTPLVQKSNNVKVARFQK